MAGETGRWCRACCSVAVMFLLCSLVPSLTCFSLRWLSKEVPKDKVVTEAAVTEIKTGRILFNGKELNSEPGSASAAASEIFAPTSQLKDVMDNEAALRRLNPTLHCGQMGMKLKAMGPRATDLQLDMGNARSLPLSQVPETCGYSLQQNALGLVLVVPYNGCKVLQENGNYVVPMSWLETPVKLTCPMSQSSDATPASTQTNSAQQPWKFPLPHRPWHLRRHKRQANLLHFTYDPRNPYNLYFYYYLMYIRPAPTTAKPETTTVTTDPTKKQPQVKLPAYPYYLYYPYYFYYPYYPFPNLPVTTTTTGPGSTLMTTTASMMTSASTTKTPQKPSIPYYPYMYYPYYLPMGQPNGSEIYYYPIIQHFYGKPPYPSEPTPTTKPSDTVKPSDSSPTTKPTTASAPTAQTTKPCSHKTTTSSDIYPGPMSPYVPYNQLSFIPEVSYNKAGKLPDYKKYMPQASYKSGPKAPSVNYWQPASWFFHLEQDAPQLDWEKAVAKWG